MVKASSHARTRTLHLALIVLVCALLMACGQGTGHSASVAKVTSAATPTATVPATPTAVTHTAPDVCTSTSGAALSLQETLQQTIASHASADRGGWERLPDDLALKPQILSQIIPTAYADYADSTYLNLAVNPPPDQQIGYICGVTLRIVSFQPLTSPATNIYQPCVAQTYYDPGGFHPPTSCRAHPIPGGGATLSLDPSAVGTEVTVPVRSFVEDSTTHAFVPSSSAGVFDHSHMELSIGFKALQAGTYTFVLNFWQDRSGPTITTESASVQFLFQQATREWGGSYCQSSDMQAQLPPPADPPLQVICPGGAPSNT